MSRESIAIDGPSASGKSTVARAVAEHLDLCYVDSGALYRTITWKVLELGLDPADLPAVLECLRTLRPEMRRVGREIRFHIEGVDPGEALRTPRIHERVSDIACIPEVRTAVVAWLRGTEAFGPVVMDGRDIGTVVFPEAAHKFYIDADPAERARRRHAELAQRLPEGGVETVDASLRRRDARDLGRRVAPLKLAPDARIIDTTHMTIEEVVGQVLEAVRP